MLRNQNRSSHFIQDNHLHLIDFCDSFLDEVQNPPRSGNDHMYLGWEKGRRGLAHLNTAFAVHKGSSRGSWWNLPVSSSLMMSSRRLVPPVVAITFTPPMCLLTWIHIWLTCRASSLVGTMTKAERSRRHVHTIRFNWPFGLSKKKRGLKTLHGQIATRRKVILFQLLHTRWVDQL